MIKCVMFDFGNVIGIFDTPRWYDFIRKNRGNCLEPHEMFAGSLKSDLMDYDLGKLSDVEYYSRTRLAYRVSVLTMKDFFDEFVTVLNIDRKMLDIIRGLREKGVITVLITNMNPAHAGHIRRYFPEVMESFDCKMISCEEKVAKPDPEAWLRPLD